MTLTISKFRRLLPLLAAAVFTVGCAPLTVASKAEYSVGRARLVLPSGDWQDLGTSEEAIAGSGGALSCKPAMWGCALHRATGWPCCACRPTGQAIERDPPGHWLLPASTARHGGGWGSGSPVRADCLRLKRWGSSAQWLEKNRPDLVQWLGSRQIVLVQPYSYLSYRYVTEAGAWVTVEALIDQRLLRPTTRSNDEFLVAGRPALQWSQDLARAVRQSAGMMDGHLAIPPFPFPTPTSRP